MNLIFNIDYHTNWGETIYISGDIPELGNGNKNNAVAMIPDGDSHWSLSIEISPAHGEFHYSYDVRRGNEIIRNEWGTPRTLNIDPHTPGASIFDRWQDIPSNKPYHSSAFTHCICRPSDWETTPAVRPGMLMISVDAPMIPQHATLAISGSCKSLGCWNPTDAPVMNHGNFPRWTIEIPIDDETPDIEFKFLLINKNDHNIIDWEKRSNRHIHIPHTEDNTSLIITGLFFENPLAPWRGAGVAIPVFSLRSENDFGVGDFFDLLPLIDWAADTGQRFIQLLPINDTTMTHSWTDSYPYNANSTFALHPMYLRLQEMGQLSDRHLQSKFDALAKELNTLPEVDYVRVNNAKNEFTRALFEQQGAAEMTSTEFQSFVNRNAEWLKPYAAFCVLRDRYTSADPKDWDEHSTYDPAGIELFIDRNRHDIEYVYYLQYHLDKQMRHVRAYAHSKGVALKGDIPIGISRSSVDAWKSPELFNLDCSAGAPPDDFSVLGQNWGFPTYNWEMMARDGFAWWKARFRKMSEYFDAYRIDHVLGFFRIWQIPLNAIHGLLGVFNPAMPFTPDELKYGYDFWIDPELHTSPYITDTILHQLFGEHMGEVQATYLESAESGRYKLRDGFTTQRMVADYFGALSHAERNDVICNGLLTLIEDVLFIEDPYEKGKYHPRISAKKTCIYKSLTDYERQCFDRLYEDFFYHRHNDFWYGKAMAKLPPLIDATDMLVCAEDLGMIPACVPAVMDKLEILSLEIQRMPKEFGIAFANPAHYPYMSVCTTSTHDMGGIRQWWEEDRQATQRYYNEMLGQAGEAPLFAEPWICSDIISHHLKSPSMLCILPLQDWLSTDGTLRRQDPRQEQINYPANPRHYWRYRMHITLEQLQSAESFNTRIRNMISDSGR